MRFSPGLLLSVSTVGPRTRITLLHGEGWREAAFESMAARQWSEVSPLIEVAVRGDASLPGESEPPLPLPSPPPSHDRDRVHWRLTIAYHGATFSGFAWQKAAPLPTVEGCLQEALRPLLDGKSELRLSCAGRTDAGVSALGQLVSFHSSPRLGEAELAKAIAQAAPRAGALRLVRARRMAPGYHATYSTAWRHYAYLLPPPPNATRAAVAAEAAALDKLLRPLAGAPRDFAALGRGVPPGKDTTTTLRQASARLVEIGETGEVGDGGGAVAARIDLLGDRFLRRQVRVLVATAVAVVAAAAAAGGESEGAEGAEGALLAVCTSGEPELTAPPAPAEGLVFVAAGTADELEVQPWWAEAVPGGAEPTLFGEGEEEALRLSQEYAELGSTAVAAPSVAGGAAGGDTAEEGDAGRASDAGDDAAAALAFPAALSLLEQQAACGAPLDVLLLRHVRARGVDQQARAAISAQLDGVSRCQGRLDLRLRDAGVPPSPRARLLASWRLVAMRSARSAAALPGVSAAEAAWLRALAPPLETESPLEPATRAAGGASGGGDGGGGDGGGGDEPEAERAALGLECPVALWPRFEAAFGAGVGAELRALSGAAPLDLRVNLLKGARREALAALRAAGFAAVPTPYSPTGIRLAQRSGTIELGQLPGLLEGRVEPQDEGSQLIALLLGAQPGELVADYCAGAGGKTLALAAAMGNRGRLWAMDIDERRLASGASRCAKAGVDNVQRHTIQVGKDQWLKRRKRSFDRVLVDAPCSGVGAWRRNPDARWLRRTRPLDELLPVQAEVLRRAATLARPGGTLVYATCSLLPDENERQVDAFLASEEGAEFAPVPPAELAGFSGLADLATAAPLLDARGFMRLTPARHGCDGFFAAALRRREGGWSGRAGARGGSKGRRRRAI